MVDHVQGVLYKEVLIRAGAQFEMRFTTMAEELKEKDNQFQLQVAVAGVDPKDLQVEVTADGLLVKGETKAEKKEEKGEVHTSEFQTGSLFRSIQFPKKIDADKVKAQIKNGMLTITAPIAEEARTRKVNIQAA